MPPLNADFMTARQLQEILQVDRTTIYRMADRGRVPAMKVGGQWRFPRRQIEEWLQQEIGESAAGTAVAPHASPAGGRSATRADLRKALPLACVQLIQDTFAHVLGISLTLTDMEGNPVTEPSNVCGLIRFMLDQDETFCDRQRATYVQLAKGPGLQPVYVPDMLGLLCARGLVSLQGDNIAMVIAEGIAPSVCPPEAQTVQELAASTGVDATALHEHVAQVFRLDAAGRTIALDSIQRIADIVAHVMQERNQFQATLHNIAELARVQ